MTPFPEGAFSGLNPSIARKLSDLVSRSLSSLHKRGYGIMVSTDLAELKAFDESTGRASPHTAFDAEYHREFPMAQGLFLTKDQGAVGTVWRRIVPLRDSYNLEPLSLKQSLEGLHLFYEDPGMALRRESCTVDCDIADTVIRGGAVCFGGAAFIVKEHQHHGLFKIMATLSLVLSITAPEQWDWFIATVEEHNREMSIALFPYKSWTRDMVHTREKTRDFWLCTASYREARDMTLKAAE